ncbi:MAG: hypothetical protein ACR2GK_05205 [Gemmatimonadaceae bacterium]
MTEDEMQAKALANAHARYEGAWGCKYDDPDYHDDVAQHCLQALITQELGSLRKEATADAV